MINEKLGVKCTQSEILEATRWHEQEQGYDAARVRKTEDAIFNRIKMLMPQGEIMSMDAMMQIISIATAEALEARIWEETNK